MAIACGPTSSTWAAVFTFNMNGQTRQVPIGDVVLIDFAGDGRNIPADEISKVNRANGGYVVMRSGEQFNARLQDFTDKPVVAVFSNGRRSHLERPGADLPAVRRNVTGARASRSNPIAPNLVGERGGSRDRRDRDSYQRRSGAPANARSASCRQTCNGPTPASASARGQWLRFEPSGEIRLSFNGDDMARAAGAPASVSPTKRRSRRFR